jgi:serine/threonine protein kinase/tetratricopeptide (TPR) repeat protein
MNSKGAISSAGLATESCRQCGSTSRVGGGLCLNCLLYRGLGEETFENETLESVLAEVDVRDADWRLGNYQILEEIGRGGMGVIYRARQRHSRRIVALKRILAHHADSHDTLVRFRREAEAAASLDHPNILPIYEVSEGGDGLPFFSMKFAVGGSLLENQPALRSETRRALGLMAKVARAVEYAHSRGILHRDLKPGNVLLDGRGEPMVTDFGLAKWLDESSDLTRTLTIFGTPGYIAPEQAHGPAANLKATADVYSLGAILFDLLTGRPPFLGEHALSVIQQAAEKPAPKLRSVVGDIDRDLETVCARCLEREPAARYHSAGDLAADLERWLDGRPVIARPVSPAVRTWRWTRRNPKLAASVAGCVMGGLIALAFVTFTFLPDTSPFRARVAIAEKSIAVLPFQNLSNEKQDAFFADGVQDEILNDLAKLADLKVISRTSVMQYRSGSSRNLREIAKALGVAHVVEGSVQRAGDRVRVSAQLIDAKTDTHIWAEQYDRQLADVFAIQSEIAQTIADRLKAQISPLEKAAMSQPPTTNLLANKSYLQAIDLEMSASPDATGKSKLLEADTLLEEAVKQDPKFLLAYCLRSRVNLDLYFYGLDHTPTRREVADAALQKANQINEDAGEVHLAAAAFALYGFRDYDRGRAELEIARKTLPNSAEVFHLTGLIDRRQGHWPEALRNLDRAVELDPRNSAILENAGGTYQGLRRYSNASTLFRRALEVLPREYRIRTEVAQIPLISDADIRPLHAELAAILNEDPGAGPKIAAPLFLCALMERNLDAMGHAIDSISPYGMTTYGNMLLPKEWYVGLAARIFADKKKSDAEFEAVQTIGEEQIKDQKEYAAAWSLLSLSEAALGRKNDAIEHARHACELLPPSKDALDGPAFIVNLAMIYEWVGDKDAALKQLEVAAQIPFGITYGDLKLNPRWDPLRDQPGFKRIEASLAPK